jgi:predicted deacetylase
VIRIRVDDFPNTKGEPQHTLAAYRDFHRALQTYLGDKKYLLGVIPKRCSPEDLLFIRNETDCRVGMHGIDHDEQKLDLFQNEFEPFLTRKIIEDRLTTARTQLELALGRPVDVYMPPRNRIDRRTIDVLGKAGFFSYTTGPETPEEFRSGPHSFVSYINSHPPHEYGRTDELYMRRSYMELNQSSQFGLHPVLTLHWTWETNIGLSHFHKFMEQIRTHLGSF